MGWINLYYQIKSIIAIGFLIFGVIVILFFVWLMITENKKERKR